MTSIKEKLPLLNSDSKGTRIVGYVVYAFVGLMVLGAILPSPDTGTTTTTRPAETATEPKTVESNSNAQTYPTDLGDVSIEIPYKLEPKEGIGGTWLDLAKPGSQKPIIAIRIWDKSWSEMYVSPSPLTLKTFAEGFIGEGKAYTEMTTNDGHRMLFYTFDGGLDNEGKQKLEYYAYIDYLSDKDVIVVIFGNSKTVVDGEVLAVFDEGTFQSICRSFAFVG